MTAWPKEEQLCGKTACFTGHRELPANIQQLTGRLDQTLAILYHKGIRRFFNGAALGFDQLAAERVLLLRETYPDVSLIMAIPCESQTRHWNDEQKERYHSLLSSADECRVLSHHYYTGCMNVRNRFMVDRSSVCVCYLDQPRGGTLSTVSYALSHDRHVINLADDSRYTEFLTENV